MAKLVGRILLLGILENGRCVSLVLLTRRNYLLGVSVEDELPAYTLGEHLAYIVLDSVLVVVCLVTVYLTVDLGVLCLALCCLLGCVFLDTTDDDCE